MLKKCVSMLLTGLLVLGMLSGCGAASASKPAKLGSGADLNRWVSKLEKQTKPGEYYFEVTGDITLNSAAVIGNGHKVNINLNGHTITAKKGESIRAFELMDGGLTLTGGTVEMAGADADGGLIYVDGGALTLENMVLTNNDDSAIGAERNGGVIYATGENAEAPAVVTVMGGTVINGSAEGKRLAGGSVTMEGCSELYLLDGTIQNGTAGMSGNIHLGGQSVFYMNGGTVTGGKSVQTTGITGDGGNINITAQSRMCMYAGTVSGGKAERTGGNIFVANYGKSEQQGFFQYGGRVEGGTSTSKGGNLYAMDKTSLVCLYGGEIKAGEAVNGGNLYLEACSLDMRGGTLTAVQEYGMNNNGANIYGVRATINLYDGTITGGRTHSSGGNVYVADSTVNLYGGTISDGQMKTVCVDVGGGNLFAGGSSVVNMYGGQIFGGVTNADKEDKTCAGANVMIGGKTWMHMFGGKISDGTLSGTTCRGGCVYVYGQIAGDACEFHMYGGTLENGEFEADVMRGLAVGSYSVLADESGVGTGRIFGGDIIYTGEDEAQRKHTIFGNRYSRNMFILDGSKYEGLHSGPTVGPCQDKTHDTHVQTLAATCVTPGLEQYHCDTCGDWYKLTGAATGHTETVTTVEATATTAGYTEHSCSACGGLRYTDVVPATGK